MFVLFALLAVTALLSISFLVVEVKKDGYRRIPQLPLVRIY